MDVILSSGECSRLMQVEEKNPHHLLGMHLFDISAEGNKTKKKKGIVVRALLSNASQVKVVPVYDKKKPSFELKRLHPSGLFEGISVDCSEIYAYDLVITVLMDRQSFYLAKVMKEGFMRSLVLKFVNTMVSKVFLLLFGLRMLNM